MNFTIEVELMQKIIGDLASVAKANAPDNTGRVLIKADENGVLFAANNNDTAIKRTVDTDNVTIEEEGEMVFSFLDLRTFIPKFMAWNGDYGSRFFTLKSMKSGFYIYVDTVHTTGKSSKGKIKLKEYSPFGFPIPSVVEGFSFILNSDIIKPAATKVLYAIDQNDTRSELRGINISFDEDFVYFAGTNGKMLSEYKVKNGSECKEGAFLFKYDFISNLSKILPAGTQVFFTIGEGKIVASFDDTVLYGREVIGKPFPKYHPILNNFKDTVNLSREILFESLKPLVESLDQDDNRRLTFSIKDRSLFLSSESADFMCEDNINYDGEFIIDINGAYMLKTIEAIKDDNLLIKFTDDRSNLLFDSATFENQKALITPVKRRTNV